MLGVVHFQRREFERALTLIDRALGVRPTNPAAKLNRDLAVAALERRPIEDELERDATRAINVDGDRALPGMRRSA